MVRGKHIGYVIQFSLHLQSFGWMFEVLPESKGFIFFCLPVFRIARKTYYQINVIIQLIRSDYFTCS